MSTPEERELQALVEANAIIRGKLVGLEALAYTMLGVIAGTNPQVVPALRTLLSSQFARLRPETDPETSGDEQQFFDHIQANANAILDAMT